VAILNEIAANIAVRGFSSTERGALASLRWKSWPWPVLCRRPGAAGKFLCRLPESVRHRGFTSPKKVRRARTADALYADLSGTTTRDGQRISKLSRTPAVVLSRAGCGRDGTGIVNRDIAVNGGSKPLKNESEDGKEYAGKKLNRPGYRSSSRSHDDESYWRCRQKIDSFCIVLSGPAHLARSAPLAVTNHHQSQAR